VGLFREAGIEGKSCVGDSIPMCVFRFALQGYEIRFESSASHGLGLLNPLPHRVTSRDYDDER